MTNTSKKDYAIDKEKNGKRVRIWIFNFIWKWKYKKNENTKAKKTLFTILNGEIVDLEIEDIFDSNRFYEIKAVTFSADESFLNKYLTPFKNVDLVIGIQDVDVQIRGLKALENETKNLIENQKAIIKKKTDSFFWESFKKESGKYCGRKVEIKSANKFDNS